jgi:lactobin A/cerein 7B family class IIb bacteriocin
MKTVSDHELTSVDGGVAPILVLAIFALELHIWDMIVSE